MLDRYTTPPFDHDPFLNQPLKEKTRHFLTVFREEVRQRKGFVLNQIIGDAKEEGADFYSEGVWTRGFVDRIFNVASGAEADCLLLPWMAWRQFNTDLYEEHMNQEGDTKEKHDTYQDKFKQAGIPPGLREQMEEMSEDDFRFNAVYYLFDFTRVAKEAIDMLEELPRPVSKDTVFRVQRITGEPHWPVGGLLEASKPHIERRIIDGESYFVLFPDDEELKDQLDEDDATDADWQRWNSLEVGMHVRNAQQGNSEAFDKKLVEGGIVVGFNLVGAGDLMLHQLGIKNVVVYVREDDSGFLRSPLLRQIALDDEPITIHHYTDIPFTRATTLLTAINPQEGTVADVEIPNHKVADYLANEIKELDMKEGSVE